MAGVGSIGSSNFRRSPEVDCDTVVPAHALTCEPPIEGSKYCVVKDIYGSEGAVRPDELRNPKLNADVFRAQQACRLNPLLPGWSGAHTAQ